LLVRVSEGTTHRFWETDLGSWFEKVLASENIFWGKFTEVFLGGDFTWEERRRKTSTGLHLTRCSWFGWPDIGTVPRWGVHSFLNGIHGFFVVREHEIDYSRNGKGNQNLSWRDFLHLHHHLYILSTIFFILNPGSCTGLGMFPLLRPQLLVLEFFLHEFSIEQYSTMDQMLFLQTRVQKIRRVLCMSYQPSVN